MLRNREELQILEKEIAHLKKKVSKLTEENEKIRKARLVVYRKSEVKKG
jgi:hypothetical protein